MKGVVFGNLILNSWEDIMVAHGELDLSKIDAMDLSEDVKGHLKQAWIEADSAQRKLVPEHIWSWAELLEKIEDIRRGARIHAVMYGGMDSSILEEDQSLPRKPRNRLMAPFFAVVLIIEIIFRRRKSKEEE